MCRSNIIEISLYFAPRVQGSHCAGWEDLEWNQHAGAPGFTLFPQLTPRPQMHWPRQGCTSLGRTERLLCSRSWSPDALIETLRPCRNQREGKGERGRGCKHIWHLQNPAHTLISLWEKCTGHIDKCKLYCISAEHIHADTHPIVWLPPLRFRKVIISGCRIRQSNNSPVGRTAPEYTRLLLLHLHNLPNNVALQKQQFCCLG